MKKIKFNFRAFTSLLLLWTFAFQVVTGIVLYIVPPGRIANWTNWTLLGIEKSGWESLHTIFGYLFIIFGIFHVIYNWNPIVVYIKGRIKKGFKLRTELILSFLLISVFTAGILINTIPFKSIMDFGDKLKNSWSESKNEPVISHLELKSFEDFTKTIGIDLDKAKKILAEKGIVVSDVSEKLIDIATRNDTSPSSIYEMLKPSSEEAAVSILAEGQGYGRKTIVEISAELNVKPEVIIGLLQKEGVVAEDDQTLKSIGDNNNISVAELIDIINNGLK